MLFDRRKSLPQVSQDLLAMADYIREHGWCQGQLSNASGNVCLAGAAVAISAYDDGRLASINRCIAKVAGNHYATWNDVPGRTVEEVLDLLERLAWEAAP